jgi:hypothetical protein
VADYRNPYVKISGFPGESRIPEHTHAALVRYIEFGGTTGHFLTALLSNDLKETVARADSENIQAIPLLVGWLYNRAPSACWGSPEKVARWKESMEKDVADATR